MTGVADRVRGWLVEPASGPPAALGQASAAPVAAPRVARVALLASGREARGLGAALALVCARGGPVAAAFWPGRVREGEAGETATPSARRLAAAGRGHQLTCRASGRLVCFELPAEEREAVASAARIDAVCAAVPVVLVVSAPRGAEIDALLATRERVLVHVADEALATVTLVRLAEQGLRATRLAPEAAPGPVARALALAGVAAPRARALGEACACRA